MLSAKCQNRSYVQIKLYAIILKMHLIYVEICQCDSSYIIRFKTAQDLCDTNRLSQRGFKMGFEIQIHVQVVSDCRGPLLPANKHY